MEFTIQNLYHGGANWSKNKGILPFIGGYIMKRILTISLLAVIAASQVSPAYALKPKNKNASLLGSSSKSSTAKSSTAKKVAYGIAGTAMVVGALAAGAYAAESYGLVDMGFNPIVDSAADSLKEAALSTRDYAASYFSGDTLEDSDATGLEDTLEDINTPNNASNTTTSNATSHENVERKSEDNNSWASWISNLFGSSTDSKIVVSNATNHEATEQFAEPEVFNEAAQQAAQLEKCSINDAPISTNTSATTLDSTGLGTGNILEIDNEVYSIPEKTTWNSHASEAFNEAAQQAAEQKECSINNDDKECLSDILTVYGKNVTGTIQDGVCVANPGQPCKFTKTTTTGFSAFEGITDKKGDCTEPVAETVEATHPTAQSIEVEIKQKKPIAETATEQPITKNNQTNNATATSNTPESKSAKTLTDEEKAEKVFWSFANKINNTAYEWLWS